MNRYEIVTATGTGVDGPPTGYLRPNTPGSFAVVAARAGLFLIARPELDGAAAAPGSGVVADELAGDVVAAPLSVAARTAVKTWLTGRGLDVSQFDADGVTDRRALLRFCLRRLFGRPAADVGDVVGRFAVKG